MTTIKLKKGLNIKISGDAEAKVAGKVISQEVGIVPDLPDVNGYGRGDIMVVVDITIPDELTKEERKLVERLSEQPNFKRASGIDSQNIFERMKNFFR